jgi:UDP-3-O-[3-hydroxymyristoyl] glucosamine N-acyltransferase
MRFKSPQNLKFIANLIGCPFVGNANFEITGINEIHVVEKGDIVFVDHPKYYDKALNSKATTILINKEVTCPEGKSLLISDDPFRDFNKITQHFKAFTPALSAVAETAKIGENTIIQPNVFIGNNVTIGKNCVIHPSVCLYDGVTLGDNVTIHSGSILGADAFYYKKRPTGYDKLKSCGSVLIEDNVDIGASCTIDRGVTGVTTIKEGTKIDNQVQIGHDTVIGKHCLIASFVGISGCVIIEDEVTIWGQAGIASGLTIGKGAIILGKSGISKSIAGGKTYLGTPFADEAKIKFKEIVALKHLLRDKK